MTGITAFIQFKKRKHREIERLKSNYAEATKQYKENLHAINLLEDAHKKVINIIQQELVHAKEESTKYEERYQKAQSAIADINNQYEADILELKTENERLQESINHLKRYKDLTPFVENAQSFLNTGIVMRIMQNVGKSRYSMTEAEWNDFMAAVGKHFAPLISDLSALETITPTKMRICGLSILQIRTSDIASLLDIFPQRVTNLKGELNTALFGDSSARTLYHNLVQRYNILA
jgi:hypothetical protein